ncbi:MAG: hypothetical protein IJX54_06165, partial [Oscillospiraceae bacterium]|nr:hypothetical protein [Oscillospiraceae bacterium]
SEYSDYPDTIVFKDMVFNIEQDYNYGSISEHSHHTAFLIEETGTYNENNVNIPEYYIDGILGISGRWVSSYEYITKYMNLYLDVYGRTLELCANKNRIDWYDFENKYYD